MNNIIKTIKSNIELLKKEELTNEQKKEIKEIIKELENLIKEDINWPDYIFWN